ncbi:MAG: septum formation protein Maf, partial [Spirochaetes bacterium]|nr:septum formation protein Maf [Spirochaetota bacterium]
MTDTDSPAAADYLILASTSPRRRELLEQLGLPFELATPTPDDDPADHRPAVQFARDLAAGKATSVAEAPAYAQRWILGADTVVFDDAEILLKPADTREARRMLARLAGRTHRVATALALFPPAPGDAGAAPRTAASASREPLVAADVTAVTFAAVSEGEIEWYLDTEEWRGVAGAYRIQGRGAMLIERIEGSYSGVMGL